MPVPIVAIVGRPNVGKSTLFNRLIKRRLAIVHGQPGVTRDLNYHLANWNRRNFYLVDSGGYIPGRHADRGLGPQDHGEIARLVREQVDTAIQEADLVVLVTDVQVGTQEEEQYLVRILHKSGKPAILAVNKVDSEKEEGEAARFARLGLGEPVFVSAASGRGTGELLDKIAESLPKAKEEKKKSIPVAVVGRPNVGKSSLVNALLGKKRVLVSPNPGTTRDAIDTELARDGQSFTLIDTAGLRRKAKVKEDVEFYSNLRALSSISRAEVCFLVIDAMEGVTGQDMAIASEILDQHKILIWAVNKWDLVEKDEKTAEKYADAIQKKAGEFFFAPVIFISALTKQRVSKLLPLAAELYEIWSKRVTTSKLNAFLEEITQVQPPPAALGRHIKLYYGTQVGTKPPEIVFFSNFPKLLADSYKRYILNQLREQLGFDGVPIKLSFKARREPRKK
ncbi:MAG: ribosome biogenesis GTPase Der [candidate division Zixibacteria bacterium]|nr:ribosome biogenesis GTPase Der [candidate division Zixibacteria bacterium]